MITSKLLFPLSFMALLSFFSSLFIGASGVVSLLEGIVSNSILINGSSTTISIPQSDVSFNFDPVIGAITWIVSITVLSGVVGIQVVGSGLNTSSTKMIVMGTAWITAFIFFGMIAYPLIITIPDLWGELLFLIMTIWYAFGVFEQLGGVS